MATTATGGNLISQTNLEVRSTGAPVELVSRRRKIVSPAAGRGLEILGHAIEYLADEFSLECMERDPHVAPGIHPRIIAIELLKSRNREIYYSCPDSPTLGERLMSWLHLQSD